MPEIVHTPAELAHSLHRLSQVRTRDSAETVGIASDGLGNLVIADQRTFWTVPGRHQSQVDIAFVHGRDRLLERQRLFEIALDPRPAPERLEHRMVGVAQGRVLHPHIDDPVTHCGPPHTGALFFISPTFGIA